MQSLSIKFPNQYPSPGDYESLSIFLPKTIKLLLLQPISNQQAKLLIPTGIGLQSLSLVLDRITDELLASIAGHLPLLDELCLEDRPSEEPSLHSDLTNGGLLSLGFCRKLKRLSLTRSRENCPSSFRRVNDVGVLLLAEKCKELESVRFAGFSKVTDAGYASILHSCKNLKRFEIVNAFFLSDLAFHDLANAPTSLVDVRLISCKLLTSETAQSLSFCQNLEILDLSGCKSIADSGLKSISKLCKKLNKLDVSGADITDSGLSALGMGSSPISSLSLRGCKRVTDRGISLLFHGESSIVRTLTSLDLGYMPGISDRAISIVAEVCRELTSLCIRHCFFVSDASIRALGSLKGFSDERRRIRKLDLYNCCGLSINSYGHLAHPFFLGLRWLGVGNTRLSGKGRERLLELSRNHPGLSICTSGCEMCCNVGWQFHESI